MSNAKQRLLSQIHDYNSNLNQYNIPFRFSVDFEHSHPALMLNSINQSGSDQLRKGNYAQVEKRLVSEFDSLMQAFTNRPVMVRMANGTEVIEKNYDGQSPIIDKAQQVVNLNGLTCLVTVANKYVFTVSPK